jgi:cell division protein FtsI (penicillin-binding protein 3)
LIIGSLFVLTIFAGRLLELQAFRGDALAAAAVDQRTRTVTVLADRGPITDRNGAPLATTIEARHVTADQTLIGDPYRTAMDLAPFLGMQVSEVAERLTGDRRFVYVAKDLTPETWRSIDALGLPGIFSERTTKRVYPAGEVGANVVGFVGAEGEGLGGIEYAMDEALAGIDGWRTFERGFAGPAIPTADSSGEEPIPGAQVRLTLDRDIQYMAQRAISDAVASSGAESGSVVVMDPRTGEILALASTPTFDANDPGSAEAADLGNRALTDAFEPGSTTKVITVAAVLEEGGMTPDTIIEIPPTLLRAGKVFHDARPHGGYTWDLTTTLARSSNIGMILAAESVGGPALYDYLRRFGIGRSTGLGFPGETIGFLPDPADWSGTTFPTLTFGQGFSVNAVHAASVFSTIANDGVRMQPSLVLSTTDAEGRPIEVVQPVGEQVVSATTARQVREMLETVVADGGTAPMAGIPGYRIGGKTGTAQAIDPECGCYDGDTIGSFIGMAPIEEPELVVGVTIVRPSVQQFGGELAGPVFRDVMTYSLQARQVAPLPGPALDNG